MEKLKERITENGIDYILVGGYYIPDLKLPEENRPIGRYGRLHREYLKQEHPARYSSLILTGKLWTYLADLNEQAEERLAFLIFLALQYRPNHGSGDFLLAGRCAFPQFRQFPYFTDFIIFQRIPQQIIRGDFQCVADIDKYGQAGNLCPALNLPEVSCVDIASESLSAVNPRYFLTMLIRLPNPFPSITLTHFISY